MSSFGNCPAKIDRYQAFWNRSYVSRPLVGFTFVGWFPFEEFAACRAWSSADYLTPGMIHPEAFIEDHLRLLSEGERIDDDLIRGACPAQAAIPWLPGMIGCKLRILPRNVMGVEQHLPWSMAWQASFDDANPWFCKYLAFASTLVEASGGRFPVSHSAEIGPTDLHAALRGHTESIMDLADAPEESATFLWRLGEIFLETTQAIWKHLPPFHGGYFDAQYSLWAPGPIIRMQEDATAVYSPTLYRRFVQPVDRMLARHFPCSFIHLHSTSMFLLEAFLEIEEIQAFEVNKDVLGPPLPRMIPHFQRIQAARKPLLIRGAFSTEDVRVLMGSLDPQGLFLSIMVNDWKEIESLRPMVGL